jgi:hypothetical protein
LDKQEGDVVIVVPTETLSVNLSFFLGMFAASIQSLGPESFKKKYTFVGRDISATVEHGIKEVLRSWERTTWIEREGVVHWWEKPAGNGTLSGYTVYSWLELSVPALIVVAAFFLVWALIG